MRQSHSYSRKKSGLIFDPDDYKTYRNGVAIRLLRRWERITPYEAWQLSAVPAFFLWVFRKPIGFFKRRKADRMIRRKIRSNSNQGKTE